MGSLAEELEYIKTEIVFLQHSLTTLREAADLDGFVDPDEQSGIDELEAYIKGCKSQRDDLEKEIAREEQEYIERNEAEANKKAEENAAKAEAEAERRAAGKEAADKAYAEDKAQADDAEAEKQAEETDFWSSEEVEEIGSLLGSLFGGNDSDADEEEENTDPTDDGEYLPVSDSRFFVAFNNSLVGWCRDVRSGLNSALGYASSDKSDKVKASDISGLIALSGHPAAQGVDSAVKIIETITKVAENTVSSGSETLTINTVHNALRKELNKQIGIFQSGTDKSPHFKSFCETFAKTTGVFYMPSSSGTPEMYVPEKKFLIACSTYAKKYLPGEDHWMKQFLATVLASLPDSFLGIEDNYEDMWSGFDSGYAYVEMTYYWLAGSMNLRSMTINDGSEKIDNLLKTLFKGKTIIDVPIKIAIFGKNVLDDRVDPLALVGMKPKVPPTAIIKRDNTTAGSLNFKANRGSEAFLKLFLKDRMYQTLKVSEID